MIRMLLLPAFIFLMGTSVYGQKANVELKFPERFYLEALFPIDQTESIVEVCNVQPGATYAVYLYDERDKSKRTCEYMYGQNVMGNDEFIKIKARSTCLKFNVERFDCKFESEVLVNAIMHCLDCNAKDNNVTLRDPDDDFSCDLKLRENNDYEYLVKDILLAKTCFEVVDESIKARGVVGEFWQGDFSLGMDDGIAMANAPLGSYQSVGGGNGQTSTGTSMGTSGDIDLQQLLTYPTYDAAVLEFDFYPSDEFVEFQYVFASEEYCEWVSSQYNDGFALLLSGPGISGFDYGQPSLNNNAVNLAVLPGTNGQLDFTTNVAIKTINWNHYLYGHIGQVGNFYVSNNFLFDDPRTLTGGHNAIGTCAPSEMRQEPLPSVPPAAPTECAFDAWTTVLTARFDDLIPCEKYHIKFVMADGSDRIWGSGIFLRGSSFSAGGAGAEYDITFANGEKFVYENCGDQIATLILTRLDNESTQDLFVEYGFEIGGTANKNYDYITDLENTIIIPPLPPPGEIYRFIEVIPDDIIEGVETVEITIDDPCNCDPQIIELEIIDIPPLTSLPLNNDTSCFATPQGLSANVEGGFPVVDRGTPVSGYDYQWSDENGVVGNDRNYQFTPPNMPGTYTYYLEVSDECGQTVFDTASITITGFPQAELIGTEYICDQSPSANLTVLLEGAGPWELVYAIDGVEQPSIITDDPLFTLPATEIGEYTLISVFSGGCSGPVDGIAIVSPSILSLDVPAGITSCSDSSDGELTGLASGGVGPLTYLWDNGETTETIDGLANGTYTLVVTDSLGCESTFEATISSPDEVTISAALINGTTCANPESGSAEATGAGGSGVYTYEWLSSGGAVVSTDQTPADLLAGDYTVVATDEFGCTSEATVEVTSDVNTPTADVDLPGQLTCDVAALTIDGSNSSSGGNFTYEWTTTDGNITSGSDGTTIDVDMPGTYVLVVTNDDNGCTNTVDVQVVENISDPIANAGDIQELNCTVQMAQLGGTDNSSGPEFTYVWTTLDGNIVGGSDTVNPEVDAAGTYILVVTNTENGCTAESSVVISENTSDPEILGADPADLTCEQQQQTIDASGSSTGPEFTYTWTTAGGNIVDGDNGLTPTVDNPGTYTLVITNTTNNCSTEASFEVGQVADIPAVDIAQPMVINCINNEVTLNGSGSESGSDIIYTWSTTDGTIVSDGTSSSPTVNAAGTYILTVTNSTTGCEDSMPITVTEDIVDPIADAGTNQTVNCIVTEVNLGGSTMSAGPNFTYEWTTPDGQLATSSTIPDASTMTGGTYEVLVTNTENGCTAISSVVISEDAEDPTIVEIFPQVLTCELPSQTLDLSGSSTGPNFTYEWTTPNGNIVTGGDGLSPEVDDPGTYTLLVTNTENGCTETVTYSISEDAEFPIAVINDPVELNCNTQTVSLNGSGSDSGTGITYNWETPDGNLLSSTSGTMAEVDAPGTYILVVNNEETGCSETAQVLVTQNIEDPIADAGPEQQINCTAAMVDLGGTTISTGPEFEYEWTTNNGSIVSGASSTNPTVDAGGTYLVVVTNTSTGCSSEATVVIDESTDVPQISPVFPEVLTCEEPNQVLDASGSSTGSEFVYTWTTPDGNIVSGGDGLSPTIDDPGTYTLLITNTTNSCTEEESFVVTEDADFPNVSIVDPIILDCNNESIELDASGSDSGADITYEWTTSDGNIVRNADSDIVEIDEPGTYTLTVNNAASGCAESEFVIVQSNFDPPAVDAGPGAILSCTEETVELDGSNSAQGSNYTYEWTTSAGNIISATDGQGATVDQPGTYELIITDTDNGCTNSETVVVEADENLPSVDVLEPALLTCDLQTTVIDASGSDQNNDLQYTWETLDGNIVSGIDGLTPMIDMPGTYTLTIVNTLNGCDASLSVTVDQNIVEPIADAGAPETLTCETTILNLDGDDSDLGPEYTYEWTTADGNIVTGANTLTPEIDTPGEYLLTVFNTENNCQATSTVIIMEDIQGPNVAIDNPELITCSASMVSVNAADSDNGANFESTWTDAAGNTVGTANSLDVNVAGEYTLTIVNTDNGCETFMTVEVIENVEEPDIAVAAPDVLTCADQEVMVSGMGSSDGAEFVYSWSTLNGNFAQNTDQIEVGVTEPGVYELLITNSINDCTTTATIEVIQDIEDPLANAGETLEITCADPENNLDGSDSSTGATFSYEWIAANGGFVLSGNNTLTPVINAAGSYTLIVTDDSNGCTSESTVQVTSNDVFPLANIDQPDELTCVVLETTLSASTNAAGANYSWSTSDGNILSGADTENPLIDAPGTYIVSITDLDNGCVSQSQILVIEDVENPTVDAGEEFELNCTIDEVNLLGDASQGSNFDYSWTTNDGSILSGENSLNPLVDEAGTYILTVVNTENGCTSLDDVQVRLDPNVPTGFNAVVLPPLCYGEQGTIVVDEVYGNGTYTYSLDGITYSDNNIFETLPPGNSYEIFILDENGCDLSDTFVIPAVDSLFVEATEPQIDIRIGDDATLNAVTNWPSNEIASITWTPSDSLSCDDCLNPTTTSTSSTVYTVTVVNENGCTDQAKITLKVDRSIDIYIPNAFSPVNNDGVNDVFMIFARPGTVTNV